MRFVKFSVMSVALMLVIASAGRTANANLILDGSFEKPVNDLTNAPQHYINYSGTSIPGWTITSGNVDIVDAHDLSVSYSWIAASGSQSLDLNGWDAGT